MGGNANKLRIAIGTHVLRVVGLGPVPDSRLAQIRTQKDVGVAVAREKLFQLWLIGFVKSSKGSQGCSAVVDYTARIPWCYN
jgi:hypothetical protein